MINSTGDKRSIIKLSSGYVVLLTRELKSLGLKPKEKVWVFQDGNKIIVTNDKLNIFRPYGVSENTWRCFLSYIITKYGEENLERNIAYELNKCIEDLVIDRHKIFGKTILEIKKFREEELKKLKRLKG